MICERVKILDLILLQLAAFNLPSLQTLESLQSHSSSQKRMKKVTQKHLNKKWTQTHKVVGNLSNIDLILPQTTQYAFNHPNFKRNSIEKSQFFLSLEFSKIINGR